MHRLPKNDLEYSRRRLDMIMSRRRLSFNPYTVSDERLMEIVTTTGWGSLWDLTELVTVRFTRLHNVPDYREFDGIFMTVPNSEEEVLIPLSAFTYPVTAYDTLRQDFTRIGKRAVCNAESVKKLVGKTYFVSQVIRGTKGIGRLGSVYRLHRLKGDLAKDAKTVREAMCAAKIERLRRLLEFPHAPETLDCDKGFFDYESRIRLAIRLIERFPEAAETK